jgi:uncharacterized spore protein YtfJ
VVATQQRETVHVMTGQVSVQLRTTLAPELVIGDTRVLAESEAVVLRLPGAAFVWNRPLAVTVIRDGRGQRVQLHAQRTKGVHTMLETMNGTAPASAGLQVQHQTEGLLDKVLAAAQPTAVFSAPVVSGEYTVITASEVFAGGGFGFGGGTQPADQSGSAPTDVSAAATASGSGGGGGGGSHGRPVAAIIVGPNGVKVKPIVDATRVALAVMGALGGAAFMATRLAKMRARSVRRFHQHR